MPKDITGNPDNFHSKITVPTGGDARTAASVETPFQQLADNVAHYGRIVTDGGLTRDGATRIRSVETIPDLKALTGMVPGDVCQVGRFGTYIYAGPLAGGYDVWVVESTAAPGTYWRHSLLDMTAHTTGLVQRDAQGRIGGTLGAVTLDGSLTMGTNASVRLRVLIGPDDHTTIENGKYDIVISGPLTAHRAYKLTSVGAAEGNVIRIVHSQQPGDVTVIDDSSNVLATLEHGTGDGSLPYKWSALFVFTSGAWTRIG